MQWFLHCDGVASLVTLELVVDYVTEQAMHAVTQARMVQGQTPFCKDLLLYLFVPACLCSIFQPQAVYSIWLAGAYESNESSYLTCLSRTNAPALANLTSPFHLSCQSADHTWRIQPIRSRRHSHLVTLLLRMASLLACTLFSIPGARSNSQLTGMGLLLRGASRLHPERECFTRWQRS